MSRATARGEPWLIDPGPIIKMHRQLADLGDQDHHAFDTTDQDVDTTLFKLRRPLSAGDLRLA